MRIDIIRNQIKDCGIVRRGEIAAKEGGVFPHWIEIKELFGDPDKLDLLVDGLLEIFEDGASCVAGSGFGGIPLAVAISAKTRLRLTLVRPQAKAHGKGGVIEGYRPHTGDRIVIVDDKIITGATIVGAARSLEMTGSKVIAACAVVSVVSSLPGLHVKALLSKTDLFV